MGRLASTWYLATPMTGRTGKELVHEALFWKSMLEPHGIGIISPVIEEGILPTDEFVACVPDNTMREKWKEDKRIIRRVDGIIRLNTERQSYGCERECGLARYGLWKPVIYVFSSSRKLPKSPVPWLEDDALTVSPKEVRNYILDNFGTWKQRFKWRIAMYRRCRIKALIDEVRGWL